MGYGMRVSTALVVASCSEGAGVGGTLAKCSTAAQDTTFHLLLPSPSRLHWSSLTQQLGRFPLLQGSVTGIWGVSKGLMINKRAIARPHAAQNNTLVTGTPNEATHL